MEPMFRKLIIVGITLGGFLAYVAGFSIGAIFVGLGAGLSLGKDF